MHPILAVIIVVVLEGATIWFGFRAHRIRKTIKRLATTRIADLQDGFAEVKGIVRAYSHVLKSPFSASECVYFHFNVQEKRDDNWRTIIDDKQRVDFLVEDATGQAVARFNDAELELDVDERMNSGLLDSPSPGVEDILQRHYNESTTGIFFNRRLSYKETALETNQLVYILGTAKVWPDGSVEISKGNDLFFVSDRSERVLLGRFAWRIGIAWFCGILIPLLAAFFWFEYAGDLSLK